jgi:hypothetical protein
MVDRFRMPDEKEVITDPYEDATKLLSGTLGHIIFCWVALVAALALAVLSVFSGLGCSADCSPSICTVGTFSFLAAQSVTVVKLLQDCIDARAGTETRTVELASLQPTLQYAVQCVLFYVIALGSVLYSIGVFFVDVPTGFDPEWRNLFLVQLFWLSSATVNLVKAMKHKEDARLWLEVPDAHRSEKIEYIIDVGKGARAYQIFVLISFLASIVGTALTVYYYFEPVEIFLRLAFFGCYANSIIQCFNFVKLDHDRNNIVERTKLDRQRLFQLWTVLAFLGAAGTTIGFSVFMAAQLVLMDRREEFADQRKEILQDPMLLLWFYQTLCLVTMSIFSLTSALSLGNLVRDLGDAVKLKTSAEQFEANRRSRK